jgi:hypothetical protein
MKRAGGLDVDELTALLASGLPHLKQDVIDGQYAFQRASAIHHGETRGLLFPHGLERVLHVISRSAVINLAWLPLKEDCLTNGENFEV